MAGDRWSAVKDVHHRHRISIFVFLDDGRVAGLPTSLRKNRACRAVARSNAAFA
jgi:hypothetical protein